MKIKLFFTSVIIALLSIVFSCSNDAFESTKFIKNGIIDIPELSLSLNIENGLLSFNDETAFNNTLNVFKNRLENNVTKRSSQDMIENPFGIEELPFGINESIFGFNEDLFHDNPLSLKKYGFFSLYDAFVDAMSNAEIFYEREGGYEEFKEKYSSLYFPECGEDYAAYLPLKDKEIAKLLNVKGEILIGGEIVNLIDINSYEQLIALGRVSPSDEQNWISTRSNKEENLPQLRAKMGITIYDPYNNKNVLELIQDDVKFWINATTSGNKICVEFCWRQKGFLGKWYNFSSTLYGDVIFYEYGSPYWHFWNYQGMSGMSSKDINHYRSSSSTPFIVNDGKFRFDGWGYGYSARIYHFDINMN
jgi:hypothetical protein